MTKSMKTYAPALLCLAVMGLAGCGGGGGGSSSDPSLTPAIGGGAAPAPAPAPAVTPPSLAGSSNGCFNLDSGLTAGATSSITYTTQETFNGTALPPGMFFMESLVIGNVSLEGKTVVKAETKTRTFDSNGKKVGEAQATSYSERSGLSETTLWRTESGGTFFDGSGNIAASTTSTTVLNPGSVDPRPSMVLGSSAEYHVKGTGTTTLIVPPGGTTTEIINTTSVLKFSAIENITVPAGTYLACRFEQSDKAFPASTVSLWFNYGVGALIKSETKNPGPSNTVQQATSVIVNGKKT